MPERELRVVVFEEIGWLVAQCLEVDIAVQARTYSQLYSSLVQTLAAQARVDGARGKPPYAGIPRAPQRFWRMWEQAQFQVTPVDEQAFEPPAPVDSWPKVLLRAA